MHVLHWVTSQRMIPFNHVCIHLSIYQNVLEIGGVYDCRIIALMQLMFKCCLI